MKYNTLLQTAVLSFAVQAGFAQVAPPGAPEDNGLRPKSDTIYVHEADSIFNNSVESLGIAIAANGNVIVGWEDDGADILDFEGVWTILNSEGSFVTPVTEISSPYLTAQGANGGPINTRFLAFFRADGSPISGWTAWGPKIKANLFGDGVGMGATAFALGAEVPELADTQIEAGGGPGDFPAVQLLSNGGAPVKILPGLSEAYLETTGDVRVGDWDYLSNGNVVIVGESRQTTDLVDKYGGTTAANHAVFRILTPTGTVVKSETLVSETPEKSEIWHGVGVTANGFAVRFSLNGRSKMRLFANDGSVVSTNIDLTDVVGNAIANAGGRGDGIGFHGNGKDAYALATVGVDGAGLHQVVVAVFNADGTLRWTKNVTEDSLVLNTNERLDVAIDEKGRVLVVFADTAANVALGGAALTVMGRLFDATGAPMGGTFYVSEKEVPAADILEGRRPRAFWRNNLAAITWESANNSLFAPSRSVAMRVFSTFTPGTVEAAGLTRIVADTPVNIPAQNNLDNWEPYAGVLGNTHFLVEANTFAADSATLQNFVVKIQPVTGGAGQLVQGFYADNGTAYTGQINLSRQNGNPGRVAGDKRPGAVNYIVGAEVSAHGFAEFQSEPNRWTGGAYFADNRFAGVETYSLNPTTLTPTPLTKLFDPVLGGKTDAYVGNAPEVSRFGGDVQALDNGNFVVVIDDRSLYTVAARSPTFAIITPTGEIVKGPTAINAAVSDQIWANVAPYKGGFAARLQGIIYFFDNAGTLRGSVDQNTSGETTFDRGRGDGTRIASHINSDFVFLAGGNTPVGGKNTAVKVAAFDARTMTSAGITQVAEPSFPAGTSGYDRVHIAVDALNRMVVAYESVPTGFDVGKVQSVARVIAFDGTAKTFSPLTSSFYPFVNSVPGTPTALSQIRAFRPSLAITTKQILVAAKGEINLENKPELGPTSVTQLNFYTVFSHPDPKEDPTAPALSGPSISISRVAVVNGNVTLTWTADGYALYTSTTVNGTYAKLTTTGKTYTVTSPTGTAFFKLGPP